MMDISARSLKIKRDVITKLLEAGLYPYTKRYLGSFSNHFSTIGLVGMNEAGLNAKWLRKDLTHKETQEFAKDVLNFMRNKLSDYQEKYGDLYNLEATPAESTSYRLAKHDKEHYPDIITASEGEATPYYTNSSHLPVGYTSDVFEALDVQDELQTLYTSGTVFHTFLGERLDDWKTTAQLVKTIAENYKLPYYTMSPTYSICREHGYIAGEEYKCPTCGKETEVYSRITGYYRPIKNWNDGKSQEYSDRKEYTCPDFGGKTLKGEVEEKKVNDKVYTEITIEENSENEERNSSDGKVILFARKSCPNCKMADMLLTKAGIDFEKIDAEENVDVARSYGIKTAPTLVVSKDGNQKMFVNLSNIKGELDHLNLLK